ncbi:MAG: hydroxymethylglutaryl-CoA reductase, degradative [Thermoplasmata archaeon]|jgi:hydroxymethylglutaryl-CoA reductase|nr:hydroxymethylglutaryl-CoA reductase, degradative [Euryarchaeota archaeon]MVT36233.1 hydroxymethylglutaryl-CoA reductase, degradative [Euryarchaeota archaeon]
MDSRISGFYKLSLDERRKKVIEFSSLSEDDLNIMKSQLPMDIAERMIENVIYLMEVPVGIATNFLINGKDYLIPMAIEEPSVVAAASNAARIAREGGGFFTTTSEPLMIGQVQVVKLKDPYFSKAKVIENKNNLIRIANEQDPVLVSLGGGCKDIEARVIDTSLGEMLIVHLIVDVRDAMGANAVNTMAEAVAPYIEEITGGKVYLRILSNLATYRMAYARAVFPKKVIGEDAVEGIIYAYEFARRDPYRAATHNKGIMNGIDAVLIATANDWRAVEAGAHAYASLNGYQSLTKWEVNNEGDLEGFIELPLAVGTVGGASSTHPKAKLARKILNVKDSREFAGVLAAVGLAQNFAAIRALAQEGIQRGHMSLHARNIAIMAGAEGELIDKVADEMVKEGKVRLDRAKELLKKFKNS